MWAFTPDEADPRSWRVPLCGPDGAYEVRRVAAALGCLSPDAQPVISPRDMRVARKRIGDAYVALHGSEVVLPSQLRKTDSLFDPSPFNDDGELQGVMIAFAPSKLLAETLAVPGGFPVSELHLTLAYLGPMAEYTPQDLDELCGVVRRFAAGGGRDDISGVFPEFVVEGKITGGAIFVDEDEPEGCAVALVDCQGLQAFRSRLVAVLNEFGFYPRAYHDFLPHITLAEGSLPGLQMIPPPVAMDVGFDELQVCWPGMQTVVPLDGMRLSNRPQLIVKSEALRYTLAPLYVPGSEDAHGEWASIEDIENGVIAYFDRGEFDINWQHVEGTRAGRCVGVIVWPFPVTTILTSGEGEQVETVLPAGTVYQAVVWEPWAWELVLDGRINALSLEGWATRVKADING